MFAFAILGLFTEKGIKNNCQIGLFTSMKSGLWILQCRSVVISGDANCKSEKNSFLMQHRAAISFTYLHKVGSMDIATIIGVH